MSIMDFIFGSGDPAVSETKVAPYIEGLSEDVIARLRDLMGQDYQPYGEQRIADFTPDQQAAFELTREGIGAFRPYYDEAADLARSSYGFDQDRFDTFMNPYVGQVVDEIGRLGTERLMEDMLPGVNTTFTGAGQFGSSRHADFTNRALRDNAREVMGQQAQALASGFQDQMGAYQTDQAKQFSTGQYLGNLGTNWQAATGQDAAALQGIGGMQQALDQSNLDLAYSDFLTQQQWPYEQLGFASDIMSGVPSSSSQITQQESGNPLNQVIGAGMGIAGMGSQFGWW